MTETKEFKLEQRLLWLEKSNTALVKEKERLQEYVDKAHARVADELQEVRKILQSTFKYEERLYAQEEFPKFIEIKKLSGMTCEVLENKLRCVGATLSNLLTGMPPTIKNNLRTKMFGVIDMKVVVNEKI